MDKGKILEIVKAHRSEGPEEILKYLEAFLAEVGEKYKSGLISEREFFLLLGVADVDDNNSLCNMNNVVSIKFGTLPQGASDSSCEERKKTGKMQNGEGDSEQNNIVSFDEAKRRKRQAAYEWAKSELDYFEINMQPVNIDFKSDDISNFIAHGCIISVFRDENSTDNKAILRREWPKDRVFEWNLLTNYDEIKRRAPKSLEQMLENGVQRYDFFDGANGGHTH